MSKDWKALPDVLPYLALLNCDKCGIRLCWAFDEDLMGSRFYCDACVATSRKSSCQGQQAESAQAPTQ